MEPEIPLRKTVADAWYTCIRAARPFSELKEIPPELRVPHWFGVTLITVATTGAIIGWVSISGAFGVAAHFTNAAFLCSLYAFVTVSLLDFWEHFRLEKHISGRYLSATVVPIEETVIHALIGLTVTASIVLARPMQMPLEARDRLVLIGPLLFLCLGWSDELIYHRRRALHREDILHTVSHLAAGAMLVTLFAARVIPWS